MPNSLIDQLLKVTLPSSGVQSSTEALLSPANDALRSLTAQIEGLRGVYEAQTTRVTENAATSLQSNSSRGNDVASVAANIAKTVGGTLGGGLTLLPLISGIAKLFGFGASKEDPLALQAFSLPSAISLDASVSEAGSSPVRAVSYGRHHYAFTLALVRVPAPHIQVGVTV